MGFIILATMLLFTVVFIAVCRHEHKKRQAFENFLSSPDELNEKSLLKLCGDAEKEIILLLGQVLREKNNSINQLLTRVLDYESMWRPGLTRPKPLFLFLQCFWTTVGRNCLKILRLNWIIYEIECRNLSTKCCFIPG